MSVSPYLAHVPTRQAGLTLVELMVAMALSLILMAGVLTIFASSKVTSQLQAALSTVQENGRHALYTLVREIRGAGYSGCAGIEPTLVNLIANNPPDGITGFTAEEVIFGEDNVGGTNAYNAVAGTDVIRVRGAGDSLIGLIGNTIPVNANIQTTVAKGFFSAGDILVITDCQGVDIFRATTVSNNNNQSTITHSSSNNSSNNLSKPYNSDAFVMRFKSNTYFIRDTGRDNAAGDDILALYGYDSTVASTDPKVDAIELVDGVEDMQITYGLDGDGNGLVDRFVDAGSVSAWADVLAVKLSLLVNSVENGDRENVTYNFLGASITPTDPTDFRLRQEMTSTVTLRNRVQ